MSILLHIFLHDSRIPSRDVWQRAIEQLGFPVVLDSAFDVRRDKGFRPATLRGEETGFEFYLEPAADVASYYAHIASQVSDRDQCATFRWAGDSDECASAISAAAALAKLADGVYFYPDDNLLLDADGAVETARKDLELLRDL